VRLRGVWGTCLRTTTSRRTSATALFHRLAMVGRALTATRSSRTVWARRLCRLRHSAPDRAVLRSHFAPGATPVQLQPATASSREHRCRHGAADATKRHRSRRQTRASARPAAGDGCCGTERSPGVQVRRRLPAAPAGPRASLGVVGGRVSSRRRRDPRSSC
jgi:hypothetical protein